MSRSYKKAPVFKDSTRKGPGWKSGKQIANRAVRHKKDISSGASYKKAYNSYNISDYLFRMDESELIREWNDPDSYLRKQFENYKQAYRWWLKYYRRK